MCSTHTLPICVCVCVRFQEKDESMECFVGPYEARSQSANMCRQKPQKRGREMWREGTEGGGESKTTADWLALPRDAKVHQAVKCRKSKQAFNETKAPPPPTSSCVWQTGCTARASRVRTQVESGVECGGANEQVKREHKESIN